MLVVMAGSYQPSPCPSLDEAFWKQLPSHVIGNAHHGHDRQHHEQRAGMDGDGQHQYWNDDCARHGLDWMKAHRRPGTRRAAQVMDSVRQLEHARPVEPAMRPVKPGVVGHR